MYSAICPQPSKRFQFNNHKEGTKDKMNKLIKIISISTVLFVISAFSSQAFGESGFTGFPALNVSSNGNTTEYSFPLQILLLMTGLTVLPSLVLGMTSFTRIIIVMSILRQALGTQQTPPNQVLIAISLFLTFFIMAPTFNKVYDNAALPYMEKTMPANIALETASAEMKVFMVKNTRKSDLIMFTELAGLQKFDEVSDIPFRIALPAFMTSELKTAFQIGFLLFLPFLVIDMVISSILMSLGMMMLSPMLVALPFKLLLFVLVDGWSMTVGSLVSTFAAG
ncbi:flagellar type III secretion system pore protein FliP [Alphaproteobacteria bacterium]|nr:flagellar type III secretion system pore protein FliP [Alphaproteobacteria bacterium]